MSQRFNYYCETGPGGIIAEHDMVTCGHCQAQMIVPPSKKGQVIVRIASPCGGCHKFICNVCQAKGGCHPFEKWLEAQERRGKMLAAIGVK